MRTSRAVAAVVVAVSCAACIDESRVNSMCVWSDPVNRPLDLRRRADREHLRVDAEIANDLMVRIGDAHGRSRPDLQRPHRERCIRAIRDSIAIRHRVTPPQFAAAERARPWFADLAFVFLPVALFGGFAVDRMTRRIRASFDAEDRTITVAFTTLLVPIAAAIALGVANFWAFAVEGMRLRNGHVSHRAFLIPIAQHPWIAYSVCLGVCVFVASYRFGRAPSERGEPAHARPFARRESHLPADRR